MDNDSQDTPVPDIDMMSMIDIIFLLVIFFLLVSEVASIDSYVSLELPKARMAKANPKAPPERIVVNILRNSSLRVKGKKCDMETLKIMLLGESQVSRAVNKGRNRVSLLIRADTNAPSGMLRKMFIMCMNPDIGISEIAIEAAVEREM